MTSLHLDFQRGMKPFPVAGAIFLLLAFAILALTGGYYYRLTETMSVWQARADKIEGSIRRQMTVKASRRDAREVLQEIGYANEVLRQLSLPWENLFRAVEASAEQDVTLLGMEPDVEKRIVRISCEARNIAAMLSYIKRLELQRMFGGIYLQNHQIQEQDPEKPVRFSLVASWGEAS